MHSAVFALSPEAAGQALAGLLTDPRATLWDHAAEVADLDEDARDRGHLAPRLYGHASVPILPGHLQAAKGGPPQDWGAMLQDAADEIWRNMDPEALYVIGPGTSAGAVMRAGGLAPSLLGVDLLQGGKLIARDAECAHIERMSENGPVRLVLGVTGQQGFLLGRGNQQISPQVIRRAGRAGLIVLAATPKLTALARPELHVDTGEPELDRALSGYIRVHTGAGRAMMMRIAKAL